MLTEIQIYGLKPGTANLILTQMTGREIENRLIEVDLKANNTSNMKMNTAGIILFRLTRME